MEIRLLRRRPAAAVRRRGGSARAEESCRRSEASQIARAFAAEVAAKWDSAAIRAQVVASQRNRILIQDALLKGKVTAWDFQPFQDASKQYNRNYGAELYDTDRRARIPQRPEPKKDGKNAK